MASEIPNFDDKIRLAIGNLLSKADPISISLLSAFDPSKDVSVNRGVMGGSRFNGQELDTCAEFLKIPLLDSDGNRIFTNKPSLANRIILEIQSFYPAICGHCNLEYSVEFDTTEPARRCFICFQGSHDCSGFTTLPDVASLPTGSVWMCKSCYEINNPIQRKKPKSKTTSRSNSKSQSRSESPAPKVGFSPDELTQKLGELKREQDKISKDPPKRDICEHFTIGKCPHGISGKTLHNGHACNKLHPKWCYRFARNGNHKKYGCKKGNKCTLFHPKHCPSSVADKTCFNEDCSLVHLVGTKRRKPVQHEQSYRRPESRNKQSNDSRSRPPDNKAPPFHKKKDEPSREPSQSESLNDIGNFLELRSLLTSLQDNFQKEIQSLKSEIATQETRITSLLPSLSQHVYKQFLPMPHPVHVPPMFHQIQTHQPPPLQQSTNWSQFPVSGC